MIARRPDTKARRVLRALLGVLMVLQGINHFVMDEFFVRAMPDWLPWHLELVYISGIAEIGLGAAVLVPRLRALAGWGLVALLIAVFPANVHMAQHPEQWPEVSEAMLWARLPFQALFLYWVWACALVVEGSAPLRSRSSR